MIAEEQFDHLTGPKAPLCWCVPSHTTQIGIAIDRHGKHTVWEQWVFFHLHGEVADRIRHGTPAQPQRPLLELEVISG